MAWFDNSRTPTVYDNSQYLINLNGSDPSFNMVKMFGFYLDQPFQTFKYSLNNKLIWGINDFGGKMNVAICAGGHIPCKVPGHNVGYTINPFNPYENVQDNFIVKIERPDPSFKFINSSAIIYGDRNSPPDACIDDISSYTSCQKFDKDESFINSGGSWNTEEVGKVSSNIIDYDNKKVNGIKHAYAGNGEWTIGDYFEYTKPLLLKFYAEGHYLTQVNINASGTIFLPNAIIPVSPPQIFVR